MAADSVSSSSPSPPPAPAAPAGRLRASARSIISSGAVPRPSRASSATRSASSATLERADSCRSSAGPGAFSREIAVPITLRTARSPASPSVSDGPGSSSFATTCSSHTLAASASTCSSALRSAPSAARAAANSAAADSAIACAASTWRLATAASASRLASATSAALTSALASASAAAAADARRIIRGKPSGGERSRLTSMAGVILVLFDCVALAEGVGRIGARCETSRRDGDLLSKKTGPCCSSCELVVRLCAAGRRRRARRNTSTRSMRDWRSGELAYSSVASPVVVIARLADASPLPTCDGLAARVLDGPNRQGELDEPPAHYDAVYPSGKPMTRWLRRDKKAGVGRMQPADKAATDPLKPRQRARAPPRGSHSQPTRIGLQHRHGGGHCRSPRFGHRHTHDGHLYARAAAAPSSLQEQSGVHPRGLRPPGVGHERAGSHAAHARLDAQQVGANRAESRLGRADAAHSAPARRESTVRWRTAEKATVSAQPVGGRGDVWIAVDRTLRVGCEYSKESRERRASSSGSGGRSAAGAIKTGCRRRRAMDAAAKRMAMAVAANAGHSGSLATRRVHRFIPRRTLHVKANHRSHDSASEPVESAEQCRSAPGKRRPRAGGIVGGQGRSVSAGVTA
eukprot:scaffold314913_cov28-Tisochrysis_lutea.AAC.1